MLLWHCDASPLSVSSFKEEGDGLVLKQVYGFRTRQPCVVAGDTSEKIAEINLLVCCERELQLGIPCDGLCYKQKRPLFHL